MKVLRKHQRFLERLYLSGQGRYSPNRLKLLSGTNRSDSASIKLLRDNMKTTLELIKNDSLLIKDMHYKELRTHKAITAAYTMSFIRVEMTDKGLDLMGDKPAQVISQRNEVQRLLDAEGPSFSHYSSNDGKMFCARCITVGSGTCCSYTNKHDKLRAKARPPRNHASKQKWKQFLTIFYPQVLNDRDWWQRKQAIKNNTYVEPVEPKTIHDIVAQYKDDINNRFEELYQYMQAHRVTAETDIILAINTLPDVITQIEEPTPSMLLAAYKEKPSLLAKFEDFYHRQPYKYKETLAKLHALPIDQFNKQSQSDIELIIEHNPMDIDRIRRQRLEHVIEAAKTMEKKPLKQAYNFSKVIKIPSNKLFASNNRQLREWIEIAAMIDPDILQSIDGTVEFNQTFFDNLTIQIALSGKLKGEALDELDTLIEHMERLKVTSNSFSIMKDAYIEAKQRSLDNEAATKEGRRDFDALSL